MSGKAINRAEGFGKGGARNKGKTGSGGDIAIIGMACRFPGADNYEEYWNNLSNGVYSVEEIPEYRWDKNEYYSENQSDKNKSVSKWGGFIRDVDKFDAQMFRISPREAELMDPQQRIMLEMAWSCIENAGYKPSDFKGALMGVYLGVCNYDYKEIASISLPSIEGHISTGIHATIIPNRISYEFDFRGPSLPIDTACSSSLVALDEAVHALHRGDCDTALVGGISVLCTPTHFISFSKTGMLSPRGTCRSFDEGADGYVRGEGAGLILLKPKDQAEKDGDNILAIVRGTAVNHGGRVATITSPNPFAQSQTIINAFKRGSLKPSDVTYIEAHGTGTPKGDPIEVNALKRAFNALAKTHSVSTNENTCGVGSVKTNIGHLEAASGIAGVIKVILALKHKTLPKQLHFTQLNPRIKLKGSPFYFVNENQPWKPGADGLRRAGVSSFGFGGVNGHVIIEEYPDTATVSQHPIDVNHDIPLLLCLSAKNKEALQRYGATLCQYLLNKLSANDGAEYLPFSLADFCFTLNDRENFDQRVGFTVKSLRELSEKFAQLAQGDFTNLTYGSAKAAGSEGNDSDIAQSLDSAAEEASRSRLMSHFISGGVIDWPRYFKSVNQNAKKICLPTYPFARKSYWLEGVRHVGQLPHQRPAVDNSILPVESYVTEPVSSFLHPLVHRNTSTFSQQRFSSRLTGNEFFLKDHVVNGNHVLPGVASLEMAIMAFSLALEGGETSTGGKVISVQAVRWLRPLIINESPVEVVMSLDREFAVEQREQSVRFTLVQAGSDASPASAELARGTLSFIQHPNRAEIDLKSLKQQFSQAPVSGDYYAAFNTVGLSYGPAHQSIKKIYSSTSFSRKSEVLAEIVLPDCVKDTGNDYLLHPSLIDGALQAGLASFSTDETALKLEKAMIPFALERLIIYEDKLRRTSVSGHRLWVHAKPQIDRNVIDIDAYNDFGDLCFSVKELSIRAVNFNKQEVDPASSQVVLAEAHWEELGETHLSSDSFDCRHVLVLGFEESEFKAFSESDYAGSNGTDVRILNISQNFDMRNSIGLASDIFIDLASNCFSYIQELVKGPAKNQKLLLQVVLPQSWPANFFRSLAGLMKTLHLEKPNIVAQVISLDHGLASEKTREELAICGSTCVSGQFRFDSGHRGYFLLMSPKRTFLSGEFGDAPSLPWREGGVYLITGGVGGLGYIFAHAIVESIQSGAVVLAGRRSPDDTIIDKIRAINGKGVRVEYMSMDVSSFNSVNETVQAITTSHGNLHGILHCAGCIQDSYILKKDMDSYRRVLTPKVAGVVNLDAATKDMEIDQFILFSSITAYLGNLGQADYAAANGFLDAFAEYRNQRLREEGKEGRTLSINWPFWREGGMTINAASEKWLFDKTGMVPLDVKNGLQAFYLALQSDANQVLVMQGNIPKILSTINARLPALDTSQLYAAENIQQTKPSVLFDLKGALLNMAAGILRLPVEEIDCDTPLSDFGFDSISYTEFASQIKNSFEIDVTPTVFFDNNNISDLCRFMEREHGVLSHNIVDSERQEVSVSGKSSTPSAQEGEQPKAALAPYERALSLHLLEIAAEILKLSVGEMEDTVELSEYGFDSIAFTEFAGRISERFNISVTPTMFFDYSTIADVAEHLVSAFSEVRESYSSVLISENAKKPVISKGDSAISPGRDLLTEVTAIAAGVLKLKSDELEHDVELSDYGFDSITFTEFASLLGEFYQLSISPTLFFDYRTLEALAEHFLSAYPHLLPERNIKPEMGSSPTSGGLSQQNQPYKFTHNIDSHSSQDQSESPVIPVLQSSTFKSRDFDDAVAIVGMSGSFPMAENMDEYWRNLEDGRDCISEVPESRWDWKKYFGEPTQEENKSQSKWGGFLNNMAKFDPLFFGISPREALSIDPQQRLLMMHVWLAIEDAGYAPSSLSGSNTGIFIGTACTGYGSVLANSDEGFSSTGTIPSVGPNRVSYFFNFHGPSEPIETACSSSLIAIHKAVNAMKLGDCDQALVGGVNTIPNEELHLSFSKAGMLSPDGRCKTFSNDANGYVRGEGVGILFLKKLSAAEKSGDHIYGVIRSSAVNHGGRANSLTSPNSKIQTSLLLKSYRQAGIDPRTVTYIETHGTGTALGDPIEINGLKAAFSTLCSEVENPVKRHPGCTLGAVKTNIGHLELAAGVAGVAKVLLQFKYKKIVRNLHFKELNQYMDLKETPFHIARENAEWNNLKDDSGRLIPLRAGVSSFGFGGVNAHVVLEEYPPLVDARSRDVNVTGDSALLFPLSAKSPGALKTYANNFLIFLQNNEDINLGNLAYTMQIGREAFNCRLGMVASSMAELKDKLSGFLQDCESISGIYHGEGMGDKKLFKEFIEDDDMQAVIDAWLKKGKYEKLLSLWVKGFSVDWHLLYINTALPNRVSAPGYPFELTEFWPGSQNRTETEVKQVVNGTQQIISPERDEKAIILRMLENVESGYSSLDDVINAIPEESVL